MGERCAAAAPVECDRRPSGKKVRKAFRSGCEGRGVKGGGSWESDSVSLDRLMATIRALTLIALCVFNTSLQLTSVCSEA